MAKQTAETLEYKEPAPTIRLVDKYLKSYLPGGLKMQVGDKVSLVVDCRVKEVRSGEDYDGEKRDSVELEIIDTETKKQTNNGKAAMQKRTGLS